MYGTLNQRTLKEILIYRTTDVGGAAVGCWHLWRVHVSKVSSASEVRGFGDPVQILAESCSRSCGSEVPSCNYYC